MPLSHALGTDLATLAKRLQTMGRGKDSVLAHITPEEARLLKARGGRGSVNPATGLLEFDNFSLPTEFVTATAPPTPPPAISFGALNIPQKSQQQAQPQDASPPTEEVTSSADAAPSSITVPDTFAPMGQFTVPQFTAPAAAAAPAAPEAVTASANAMPAISGPVPIPTPRPDDASTDESTSNQVKDWVSNNSTLLSILGLGGLGAFGASSAANSGQQAAALQSNLAGLAAPLSAAGNTALSTTQAGGLTPQNERVLEATRAQVSDAQSRGAVSSQQAAEAVSTTFANLLNTQLNQALTLINNADTYLQNAYIQGYQANVANQNNTTTFYTNLAELAARLSGVGGGTTINLGGGK